MQDLPAHTHAVGHVPIVEIHAEAGVTQPPSGTVGRADGTAVAWRVEDGTGAAPVPGGPSLAMGLAGVNDWTTQQPFIDVMKTAVPGTRWTRLRPMSVSSKSSGMLERSMISARIPRPRFQVVMSVRIETAIASGTHPPSSIFSAFAPRNATRSPSPRRASRPPTTRR